MKINALTLVVLIAIVAFAFWYFQKSKPAQVTEEEDGYQDPFGALGGGGGYPLGVAPVTRNIQSGDPYIAGVPTTIIYNHPDTVDVPLSMQQAQEEPVPMAMPAQPESETVQAIDLGSPTQEVIEANPPASPATGIYTPSALDPTIKTISLADANTQPIEETFKSAEYVLQN